MAYCEFTITISEAFKDRLVRRLTDAGCLGVIEQPGHLVAYFPETVDCEAIAADLSLLRTILERSDPLNKLTFLRKLIPAEDWNESWKKGFQPIDVGERFTILPPWEEKRDGRINLVIDPAMAFGTGHHETTRSCLVLLEKHAGRRRESCLDVGTGTGILAIAAAKLGCRRVVGVDTDPLAVDAAAANIALNNEPDIEIRAGSIADVPGLFDLIAANIISGVLIELAPSIASHLKPGGIAVLSGILSEQAIEVNAAMNKSGLKTVERLRDGKWTSFAVAPADLTGELHRD